MSDFLHILAMPACEMFYFGKGVSKSYEVFPLLVLSIKSEEPFEEFVKLFPSEEEGWGVHPVGAKKLYDWMKQLDASGNYFAIDNDVERDKYVHSDPNNRWWPMRGSIYSDKDENIFDDIGYLHIIQSDWNDPKTGGMPCRTGGSMKTSQMEELKKWRKRHPHAPTIIGI